MPVTQSESAADGGDHTRPMRSPLARRMAWMSGVLALCVAVPASAEPSAIAVQREQVRVLEAQVIELDSRAATARRAYVTARDELRALHTRIGRNRTQLRKARDDQRFAQAMLSQRLNAMYRSPQPTTVDALVTSGSVSDAINSWSFFQRIANQDVITVRGIRRTKERIKGIQVQLLADRRLARRQFVTTSRRFEELSKVQGERRRLLSGARAQLAAFIQAEQRRQAAIAAAAARRRIAATAPAASRSASSGVAAAPAAASAVPAGVLERIAQCESGGSPTIVSPNGQFYGKYQFDPDTWKRLGGKGANPAAAPEGEQDRVAAKLYASSGATPWPVCGRFAR